jgi:hypothetical protein
MQLCILALCKGQVFFFFVFCTVKSGNSLRGLRGHPRFSDLIFLQVVVVVVVAALCLGRSSFFPYYESEDLYRSPCPPKVGFILSILLGTV